MGQKPFDSAPPEAEDLKILCSLCGHVRSTTAQTNTSWNFSIILDVTNFRMQLYDEVGDQARAAQE